VNVSHSKRNQHTLLLIKFSPSKEESYLYINLASKKLFVKDCQEDITELEKWHQLALVINWHLSKAHQIGQHTLTNGSNQANKKNPNTKGFETSKQLVSSIIRKVASIDTCLQLIKHGNIHLQMGAINLTHIILKKKRKHLRKKAYNSEKKIYLTQQVNFFLKKLKQNLQNPKSQMQYRKTLNHKHQILKIKMPEKKTLTSHTSKYVSAFTVQVRLRHHRASSPCPPSLFRTFIVFPFSQLQKLPMPRCSFQNYQNWPCHIIN